MQPLIYILLGILTGLGLSLINNLNSHDEAIGGNLKEMRQEHCIILNEVRDTKDIARENGKKLDFLVDAYKKSLNQDTIAR